MRSTPFLDNLNHAVREHPVAAGLIGVGVAWILLGRSTTVVRDASGAARAARRTIDTTLDAATETVTGAADQVRKAATGVSDAVVEGLQAAGARIGDAVAGTYTTSGQESETNSEFARHFALPSSSRFADLLDRQPLALAAVGMAVGAAIASALPSTRVEDRLVGAAGEKVKGTFSEGAGSVADILSTAIEEAADEAVSQDLTPRAVREAAKAGAAKVKTVADAGLQAVQKSARR